VIGFIPPPVGAASSSSLTDRSSFDFFKGGLRLSRGIYGRIWHPFIG
jgi:hypothetical protein